MLRPQDWFIYKSTTPRALMARAIYNACMPLNDPRLIKVRAANNALLVIQGEKSE